MHILYLNMTDWYVLAISSCHCPNWLFRNPLQERESAWIGCPFFSELSGEALMPWMGHDHEPHWLEGPHVRCTFCLPRFLRSAWKFQPSESKRSRSVRSLLELVQRAAFPSLELQKIARGVPSARKHNFGDMFWMPSTAFLCSKRPL